MINFRFRLIFPLLLLAILSGCMGSPMPYVFAPDSPVSIVLANFSQPTRTDELLAGNIISPTQTIPVATLAALTLEFEKLLQEKSRHTIISSTKYTACTKNIKKNMRISALSYYLQAGQCAEAEYMLIPVILGWQDRNQVQGQEIYPSIVMDIFLLDIKNKKFIARSRYDEEQSAVFENLLDRQKFKTRGMAQINTEDLALEGILKAIEEFGL